MPNARAATVDRQKVEDYLLSATHPIGGPRARFFFSVGFTDAVALENALLEVAWIGDVASMTTSAHGVKYTVDGVVSTPSGRLVKLRTIWIVERADEGPRFVTAYPF
jgi:hypothetical protein